MKRSTRGFTLIELLVVIAIIALLIGILLPSLSKARDLARQITGAAMQRQFGQGQAVYMGQFKDFYAGPNTSGAAYQALTFGAGGGRAWDRLLGETSSSTPTTVYDWISPIIGDSVNLPANRARRTQQLLNKYGCKSATRLNDEVWSGSRPGDRADFDLALVENGFKQVSYLSPAGFHLYSKTRVERGTVPRAGVAILKADQFGEPVVTPEGFSPRLDKVGIGSAKVMVMDGTRYWDAGDQKLDFDPDPNPTYYSSFIDPGPTFHGSAAYGRDTNNVSGGMGWRFSVRHSGGKVINAGFFDGHVRSMGTEEMWTEAKLFYPQGSVFTGRGATAEAAAKYEIGKMID